MPECILRGRGVFLESFSSVLIKFYFVHNAWRSQKRAELTTGRRYVKRITASGRPHRCCHLTNNFDSRRTFPVHVLQLGREMPPIAPFPVGDPDPHLMNVSFDPPKSTTQKASRLVHRFSTALGCDQQMHRHTDTAHCDS